MTIETIFLVMTFLTLGSCRVRVRAHMCLGLGVGQKGHTSRNALPLITTLAEQSIFMQKICSS